MAGERRTASLGDLIDVKHGFAFSGEYIHDEPRGDVLLTPGNFAIGGGFKGDKFKYYDGPVPDEFVLKEGDLLVTMTDLSKQSDTLGFPAFVSPRSDGRRYLHNQRLGKILIKDKNALDTKFLHYLLCSSGYRHEVLAGATGTTVKHTSPDRIKRFHFPRPRIEEQRAIAHILGTLDDKIELNRRMNETLEAMARALFKSWFVDFDPVHHNIARRMASLPKAQTGRWFVYALECEGGSLYIGFTDDLERRYEEHRSGRGADWTKAHPPVRVAYWETTGSREDAVEREKKLKSGSGREWLKREIELNWTPRRPLPCRLPVGRQGRQVPAHLYDLFPDSFEDSELGEIPKGWGVSGLDGIARFLNGLALQKFPPDDDGSLPVIKIAQLRAGDTNGADRASAKLDVDYIVNDGDVLFSWSGSLECVLWAGGNGALNQHLFKVTSERFPKWFYYLWIRQHLPDFRHTAAGKATTMGHIKRHHLSDAKVIVPNRDVLAALNKTLSPTIEQIIQRRIESRTLVALRDTLLPKLISGELRVKDAEQLVKGKI